jgi:rhodanese-related sulfurtransferase
MQSRFLFRSASRLLAGRGPRNLFTRNYASWTRHLPIDLYHATMDYGFTIIDVREPEEHEKERLTGTLNVPLSQLKQLNEEPTWYEEEHSRLTRLHQIKEELNEQQQLEEEELKLLEEQEQEQEGEPEMGKEKFKRLKWLMRLMRLKRELKQLNEGKSGKERNGWVEMDEDQLEKLQEEVREQIKERLKMDDQELDRELKAHKEQLEQELEKEIRKELEKDPKAGKAMTKESIEKDKEMIKFIKEEHSKLELTRDKVRYLKKRADRPLYVHCDGGQRSEEACNILESLGFDNLRLLNGGIYEISRGSGLVPEHMLETLAEKDEKLKNFLMTL